MKTIPSNKVDESPVTILEISDVEDSKFGEKFAHFLTRTSTVYGVDKISMLADRGIENRLLDGLLEGLPDGVIIAGGFMTTVIDKEKDASDIDFFFTSAQAFVNFTNLLLNPPLDLWAYQGYKLKEGTSLLDVNKVRYLTFTHATRPPLQLLRMVWYTDPTHICDSFDLTVAQFAVDNKAFYFNPISFLDLSRKRLVLHRMQFCASTLRRVIKYSKKGFYACPGSLVKICEEIQKFKGPLDSNDVVYLD